MTAFSGNYEVVDQVANEAFRLSEIDVRFTRDEGGIATANVRYQKGNVKVDVAYQHCVSPAPRAAAVPAGRDASATEAVTCQASFTNAPILHLRRSLDGTPVSYQPVSVFSKPEPITSNVGTLAMLSWGASGTTAYFLRKTKDAALRTLPKGQIPE